MYFVQVANTVSRNTNSNNVIRGAVYSLNEAFFTFTEFRTLKSSSFCVRNIRGVVAVQSVERPGYEWKAWCSKPGRGNVSVQSGSGASTDLCSVGTAILQVFGP